MKHHPRTFDVIVTLTLLAIAGCDLRDAARPDRLFTDDELLALEQRLEDELQDYRTRTCERPLLRGEALEGSNEADMGAIFDADGELASCFDSAAALTAADLQSSARGDEAPGAVREALARCAALPERVEKAIRHRDACSPFLPGRRPIDDGLILTLRAGKALALLADEARREGRPAAAAELLLDGFLFTQDVSRGGPSFATGVVSVSAAVPLRRSLGALLDLSGELSAPTLDQLERSLTQLIASEPHPRGFFAGERATSSEEYLRGGRERPRDEERDDAGGAGDGPRALLRRGGASLGFSEREESALAMLAYERVTRSREAACPLGEPPRQCRLGVVADSEGWARAAQSSSLTDRLRALASRDRAGAFRERALDVLAAAGPSYGQFVDRVSQRGVALAALRLHVAVRREVQDRGVCAPPASYSAERWGGLSRPADRREDLLRDPYTGAQLVIAVGSRPGTLSVSSPAADELRDDLAQAFRHEIDCDEMLRRVRESCAAAAAALSTEASAANGAEDGPAAGEGAASEAAVAAGEVASGHGGAAGGDAP